MVENSRVPNREKIGKVKNVIDNSYILYNRHNIAKIKNY